MIEQSHRAGTLHLENLYDVLAELEAEALTDVLESCWFDEVKRDPDNPSLIRATIRAAGWKVFFYGLLLIPVVSDRIRSTDSSVAFQEALNLAQPLMLRLLINYFEPCSTIPTWQAWLLVMGVIMCLLCLKLIFHQVSSRLIAMSATCNIVLARVLSDPLRLTNAYRIYWIDLSKGLALVQPVYERYEFR